MHRFALSLGLLLLPTALAAQTPSVEIVGGVTAGLVDEGYRNNAFTVGAYGELSWWAAHRLGAGLEASYLSAFNNGCDAACNANARAYGGAVRVLFGLGPGTHADLVSVGAGIGLFQTRYTTRIGSTATFADAMKAGVVANISVRPNWTTALKPMFAIRGLALPNHNGAHANFLSFGIGLPTS